MSSKRLLSVVVVLGAWVVLQATAPRRTNPRVDPDVALDAAAAPEPVFAALRRSCFDCHSFETRWPWYASVAPMSWLVASDVTEGRGQMNFSRWQAYNPYDRADLLDKICDEISAERMPLWQYRLMHPAAQLSAPDVAAICGWAQAEADKLAGVG